MEYNLTVYTTPHIVVVVINFLNVCVRSTVIVIRLLVFVVDCAVVVCGSVHSSEWVKNRRGSTLCPIEVLLHFFLSLRRPFARFGDEHFYVFYFSFAHARK